MLYSFSVFPDRLTDDQIESLQGGLEVVTDYSPREISRLSFFDCMFPNGDVYPLIPEAIDIASCQAI